MGTCFDNLLSRRFVPVLVTLYVWLYLLLLFLVYGHALLRFFAWLNGWAFDELRVHLAIQAILGMVFLTVAGMFFSLFVPLGAIVNILFLLGGLTLSILAYRNRWLTWLGVRSFFLLRRGDAWLPGLLLLILIFALDKSTGQPTNPDTLGYHAQAIRWVESYPAVPGLGNLHHRLAFNSSWLLLNGLFSFVYVFGQSLRAMAGLLFMLTGWYFASSFVEFFKTRAPVDFLCGALLLISVYFTKSELSSPGTDLPAVLFAWVVLALFLQGLVRDGNQRWMFLGLAFIFSVFAVTIKLSVVALGLLAIFVLFLAGRQRYFSLYLLVGAAIAAAPWLARNVVLSGYLLFPFPSIDIFDFDWKIPIGQVFGARDGVLAFARIPHLPVSTVMELSTAEWIPVWFERATLVRKMLFLGAIFFSPALVLLGGLLSRKLDWQILGVYVSLYFGLLYWFFSAPDFRFGFGFVFAVLLVSMLIFWQVLPLVLTRGFALVVLAFSFAYPSYLLVASLDVDSLCERAVVPLDYQEPPVDVCYIGEQELFCSRIYGLCGYQAFPCALKLRYGIEMRGDNWQEGFRNERP
jgi:hypothetical protein